MHSRPHAKVTQQVTWYIPSPHSETNVTTKQRPFSVLAGPSQENRLTQSNVPPWFGTQQEARIRPLPKRSQQKKNEPVQFFQRSLQEVEAHGPSGQSRPLPGITQIHERSRKTPLSIKKKALNNSSHTNHDPFRRRSSARENHCRKRFPSDNL